jgi:hypothetical protein
MENILIPHNKKITGKICFIGDLTLTNGDLDSNIHEGFTIGNGKQLYWEMIWHSSGHVTVYSQNKSTRYGRYISGDTEITIHFK